MAVDTRSRRASVLGITGALLLALPLSDGTVGQEDRQHAAFSYAGVTAGLPVDVSIWTAVTPASPSWSAVTPETDTWTPVTPETTTWT